MIAVYTVDVDTSKLKVGPSVSLGKNCSHKQKMARHMREKKTIKKAALEGSFKTNKLF